MLHLQGVFTIYKTHVGCRNLGESNFIVATEGSETSRFSKEAFRSPTAMWSQHQLNLGDDLLLE